MTHLDFEGPIIELEEKIEQLKSVIQTRDSVNLTEEIARLQLKARQLRHSIYAKLTDWQIAQVARHPLRPHFTDYIPLLFDGFEELKGDRCYGDDSALIGGFAEFDHHTVMILGQEKGRTTKERLHRHFGMVSPEGYRKAQRLFRLAEKFNKPILTFIDTAGAYPGVGAESRGQGQAIAESIATLADIKVPVIAVILGEGCSGGALALANSDRLLMLQYSTYSTISPEGCASIIWKDASKAVEACQQMAMIAVKLLEQGLCDEIIPEPSGGAQRDISTTVLSIKKCLLKHLEPLKQLDAEALVAARYQRWRQLGY